MFLHYWQLKFGSTNALVAFEKKNTRNISQLVKFGNTIFDKWRIILTIISKAWGGTIYEQADRLKGQTLDGDH